MKISLYFTLAFVIDISTSLNAGTDNPAGTGKDEVSTPTSFYKIEGKVYPPEQKPKDWFSSTKVILDGGKNVGFLKEDNTFVINGVLPGSYLVEVSNPDYFYEPVRIDITSKGKIRARKVNNIQPSQVTTVAYPLKLKSPGKFHYFHKREEWKMTDMLMNPMVMMLVLPLLFITVLPKMMNDPETKKEMEQMQQNMNMQNKLPEASELMASFFGGSADRTKKKPKPISRR